MPVGGVLQPLTLTHSLNQTTSTSMPPPSTGRDLAGGSHLRCGDRRQQPQLHHLQRNHAWSHPALLPADHGSHQMLGTLGYITLNGSVGDYRAGGWRIQSRQHPVFRLHRGRQPDSLHRHHHARKIFSSQSQSAGLYARAPIPIARSRRRHQRRAGHRDRRQAARNHVSLDIKPS